jgi:hypothetical protein
MDLLASHLHAVWQIQVALAYLALSGLVGLAVTYYYDNEANAKLHTILKYGLKLLGLAAVATSTSLPQASAALAALLVLLDVVLHMLGPRRALSAAAAAAVPGGTAVPLMAVCRVMISMICCGEALAMSSLPL